MEVHLLKDIYGKQVKLHLNLKQMRQTDKLTQIILTTTVNKQRIRVYTKLRVEPQYWDKTTNRCRMDAPVNKREKIRLEQINKQIERIILSIYKKDKQLAEKGKYLSVSAIRQVVEERQQPESVQTDPIIHLHKQVEEYVKSVNL